MTVRYLLDTGPTFDCMFRRRGVHERVREARGRGAKVGIALPVLGEVMAGVEASASRDATWDVVRREVNKFVLWPFNKAAALQFGRIFADLKRRGRIIQQIDMQIAAIALTLGNCTVVSTDSDLTAVSGLTVENWAR
jgi:tRNA(fMet)-specific endonuclease VapC